MGGQADKERLFYLLSFIAGDIESILKNAKKSAIEQKVRHPTPLLPIAQEASLAINQVLLGAKKEFGIGGLEAETPLDPATRAALAKEIEEIDAAKGLPIICEELMEELGIDFIRNMREELERIACSKHNPEERIKEIEIKIHKASEAVRSTFSEQDLLVLIEEDLKTLHTYYLDTDHFRS